MKTIWETVLAKFRGQIIMSLFRLLTPEEISELTTSSSGNERVELNNLIEFELQGNDYKDYKAHQEKLEQEKNEVEHKAKVLQLNSKNETSTTAEQINLTIPENIKSILDSFILRCRELEKNPLGKKRLDKKKRNGLKKQMSTFILEEKDKMDESYAKLKTVEIMSLYKKNASVDIGLQKNNSDDLKKSSQSGVLVNKKRA